MTQASQEPANTDADTSPALPGWVVRLARPALAAYWVCLAVGTHWPNLLLLPPEGEIQPLDLILKIDIPLHMAGFGGLMVLLILSGLGSRGRSWAGRCKVALAIGLIYMVIDECTQHFVPGRSVSFDDFVNNAIAIIGVYILALLPGRREPTRPPRKLIWALVIGLPILAVLTLSKQAFIVLHRYWLGVAGDSTANLPMDHLGHGVVSAVVSVIVIVVWPMSVSRARAAAFAAMVVLIAAGPGIEVAQHYTGRSVEAMDALAHAIGVLLAMIWWAARLTKSPQLREPATP